MVVKHHKIECIMLLKFKESFEFEIKILCFKIKICSKEQLINASHFL